MQPINENRTGAGSSGAGGNDATSIEQTVREFVVSSFLFGEGGDDLAGDDSFIEKGILDSTGVLELVTFVEETYGISIGDDELVPDNMDTVDSLVAFIQRKLDS